MTITKVVNTKMLEVENYYFNKYIRHDFDVFIHNDDTYVFFKLKRKLYLCLLTELNDLFDADFLKGDDGNKFFYENNGMFDERVTQFEENNEGSLICIPLDKQMYYKNTFFCGMSQFIMTPFSDDEIWFCDKYTDSIYLVNLETWEVRKKSIGFRIDSIHFVPNIFFVLGVDKTKDELYNKNLGDVVPSEHDKELISHNKRYLYQWSDLKFPPNMTSITDVNENEQYYSVNYKGSVVAKICGYCIKFYDVHLNVVYEINNFLDLINYKPMVVKCCNEHKNTPNVIITKINDNCLFYYESIDLLDTKHWIICNGLENVYCYDFSKEEIVLFENRSLDYFVADGFPFRENSKIKLMMYEYYPAGSWTTICEPIS